MEHVIVSFTVFIQVYCSYCSNVLLLSWSCVGIAQDDKTLKCKTVRPLLGFCNITVKAQHVTSVSSGRCCKLLKQECDHKVLRFMCSHIYRLLFTVKYHLSNQGNPASHGFALRIRNNISIPTYKYHVYEQFMFIWSLII